MRGSMVLWQMRGIGEFGYHSWLIFTRDQGATVRMSRMPQQCLPLAG